MLAQLQLGEFINEQPAVSEVEYTFKHALTQEVAYNSLLTERRRALHEQVGRTIEQLYVDQLKDHYNDLAYHYLRSNDGAKAICYAQLAAEKAAGQGNYAAATDMISSGLKLLDQLPRGAERLQAELGLRNIEASVAYVLHGGTSHEHEHALRRMCKIGDELGGDHLLRGQIALTRNFFNKAEHARGLELARHCVDLAEARRDPGLLVDARATAGILAMFCGNFREAIAHFELGREISLPLGPYVQAGLVVAGVGFSLWLASTLLFLGRLGEAARMEGEGLGVLGNRTTCLLSTTRLSFVPCTVVIGASQKPHRRGRNRPSRWLKNTGFHCGSDLHVSCMLGPSRSWGKSKQEWRNWSQQSRRRS